MKKLMVWPTRAQATKAEQSGEFDDWEHDGIMQAHWGGRWDVIVVMPTYPENAAYRKAQQAMIDEVLPTKLKPGGRLIAF